MPWVGNQYIFPRAAPAYATWPVTPPAAPAPPPAIPQRWMRPEQTDGGNGDFGDPPDSSFGGTPPGPTAPGTDTDPDPGPPLGVSGLAPLAGFAGGLLAGPLGVAGLGLLGAISDVSRAEEALAEEYGAHPPGFPNVAYAPEISTWDTFLSAISPFGIFGQSVEEALAQEVGRMGVVGLEGIGYGGFGVPGVEEQEAAEAWGGFETAPPDAPFGDTYAGFGFGFGGGGYGGGPGTGGAGPGGTGGGPGGGPGTGGGVGDDAGSPF
jgi:hypothetical protein